MIVFVKKEISWKSAVRTDLQPVCCFEKAISFGFKEQRTGYKVMRADNTAKQNVTQTKTEWTKDIFP